MKFMFYPALYWGAVLILATHIKRWNKVSFFLSVLFFNLSIIMAYIADIQPLQAGLQICFLLLVSLVPLISLNAQEEVQQDGRDHLKSLQRMRGNLQSEQKMLRDQTETLNRSLTRLENRFSLVQTLATKIDSVDILTTLGNTWKNVAGVKACLLLQQKSNGNWEVVYSHNVAEKSFWPKFLVEHEAVARSRQIRHYTMPDKHPAFHKIIGSVKPPFLLVPILWDEDVLALGYVEVADPEMMAQCSEELTVGRQLVSIGLRRAFLYSLLTERSRRDALTGAYLRRVLMERINEFLQKFKRYKKRFYLALVDIDHFKAINDRWGHPVGDRALVFLSETVRRLSAPEIFFARYGGDEFAFLLDMEDEEEAMRWLDQLRKSMEEATLDIGPEKLRHTLSVGLAACSAKTHTPEELLEHADQALYEAKKSGRNRVVLWKGAK